MDAACATLLSTCQPSASAVEVCRPLSRQTIFVGTTELSSIKQGEDREWHPGWKVLPIRTDWALYFTELRGSGPIFTLSGQLPIVPSPFMRSEKQIEASRRNLKKVKKPGGSSNEAWIAAGRKNLESTRRANGLRAVPHLTPFTSAVGSKLRKEQIAAEEAMAAEMREEGFEIFSPTVVAIVSPSKTARFCSWNSRSWVRS